MAQTYRIIHILLSALFFLSAVISASALIVPYAVSWPAVFGMTGSSSLLLLLFRIHSVLFGLFYEAAYYIPLFFVLAGVMLISFRGRDRHTLKLMWFLFLLLTLIPFVTVVLLLRLQYIGAQDLIARAFIMMLGMQRASILLLGLFILEMILLLLLYIRISGSGASSRSRADQPTGSRTHRHTDSRAASYAASRAGGQKSAASAKKLHKPAGKRNSGTDYITEPSAAEGAQTFYAPLTAEAAKTGAEKDIHAFSSADLTLRFPAVPEVPELNTFRKRLQAENGCGKIVSAEHEEKNEQDFDDLSSDGSRIRKKPGTAASYAPAENPDTADAAGSGGDDLDERIDSWLSSRVMLEQATTGETLYAEYADRKRRKRQVSDSAFSSEAADSRSGRNTAAGQGGPSLEQVERIEWEYSVRPDSKQQGTGNSRQTKTAELNHAQDSAGWAEAGDQETAGPGSQEEAQEEAQEQTQDRDTDFAVDDLAFLEEPLSTIPEEDPHFRNIPQEGQSAGTAEQGETSREHADASVSGTRPAAGQPEDEYDPQLVREKKRKNYLFPPEHLLEEYPDITDEHDPYTQEAAKALMKTFEEFNIEAELIGIQKGPVVTMFEILPAPGVRVSSVTNLADNIALQLAASRVRIVAPIPGKQAVGIEVPNRRRNIVSFKEMLTAVDEHPKYEIPMVLGKDITGEYKVIDLVRTPHLLIAGATGSGKSVCVNSLINSILYRRSPREVRLMLIDPKIVELKLYNDIPHLLTPVVTDAKKSIKVLQYCLGEMERRYALLDAMAVRDIRSYNKKVEEKRMAAERLPYIVVIIDEFADLMNTAGKELEHYLSRLAAMVRAVGIHLVLATQRPSTNVITGLIKANIPSRIAFMVVSNTDSRIIIDMPGAEKLLGKGDMLFMSSWEAYPSRIQGAFLSEDEVEKVVGYVKSVGEPDYLDESLFEDEEEDEDGDYSGGDYEDDPLMPQALKVIQEQDSASASMLQRRLKIGYNRAARIIETMEEMGIVGPAQGSKPREVLKYTE